MEGPLSVLSTFSAQEFNTQREQWENFLKAELKLSEIGSKDTKLSIDAGNWPTPDALRWEAPPCPEADSNH